jgi:hypothetical protein
LDPKGDARKSVKVKEERVKVTQSDNVKANSDRVRVKEHVKVKEEPAEPSPVTMLEPPAVATSPARSDTSHKSGSKRRKERDVEEGSTNKKKRGSSLTPSDPGVSVKRESSPSTL